MTRGWAENGAGWTDDTMIYMAEKGQAVGTESRLTGERGATAGLSLACVQAGQAGTKGGYSLPPHDQSAPRTAIPTQ